ncbi:MAG: NLP/P60 protein [candidate division TM6 bacterium GW2011_GWF2_32_72]|nr:MAG: NLP/P60 protein [candidate division TM6 bacterium GW2011_GWF2_32_72]
MKNFSYFLIYLILIIQNQFSLSSDNSIQKMVIQVPIASIFTEPTEILDLNKPYFLDDDLSTHNTQVIYGDYVLEKISENGWSKIIAIQQPNYNRRTKEWNYCEGWIESKNLKNINEFSSKNLIISSLWANIYSEPNNLKDPMFKLPIASYLDGKQINKNWWSVSLLNNTQGYIKSCDVRELNKTKEKSIPQLRQDIAETAELFLNQPYVWGGTSAFDTDEKKIITGVDCAGLVGLTYKSFGIKIPRDSHPQYAKAKPILHGKDLQPGDLAFLKQEKHNYERVSHVMIYIGDQMFIESTGKKGVYGTQKVSAKNRFGKELSEIYNEDIAEDKEANQRFKLCFGSFLNNPEDIAQMMDQTIKI